MSKIVVTGATGELGKLVVQHLLQRVPASEIAVSVRNVEKASAFADLGIEVRYGDFENPASMEQAFAGASKLLLISSPEDESISRVRKHVSAIESAKKAGVPHIVYTSFAFADVDAFAPLANVHLATEFALKTSGIPATVLRNTWYQELYINPNLQGYIDSGLIINSAGAGKINTATRDDLALATATVLVEDGHEDRVYELASSEAWSYDELADILSQVSGKKVAYQSVSDADSLKGMLGAGLPEGLVQFLVAIDSKMAAGTEGHTSKDLETLIGRKPTSILESITQLFNK
ncbi:NAD(P)-dependent oxidoreductase [Paenibacillus pectinilyticus]|uniref:NAD(P)-dependent oxidoreductase n=1 Tax=Paenibacillus pectinilyticus TaxID=512399 RepID=A0A1C1A5I9_9BACL|nr:SDR family oxidoreductase [Paenibacillus pectinilyticus]OCT15826.1 NAD(P)-dependent oxidoreductase [Paenibacillus pectinilyticus]